MFKAETSNAMQVNAQEIWLYRKIKDFLYVTSHSGVPGIVLLGFLVAAWRFIVVPPTLEIIENLTKGYAGVVEKIIESDISCQSVPMVNEWDKCFMRYETTAHADGTVTERQIPYYTKKSTWEDIYPLGYSERLNMTYEYVPGNIIHYNAWQRPGWEIIPTNGSSVYTVKYPSVTLGEIPIWFNKQTNVASTYSQSFTLSNQSDTTASFRKSKDFQLHSDDLPKDAEIATIARELQRLLQNNQNNWSITITPRASIEWKRPEAILGQDLESDLLNRQLANQRGKYIYDRLIIHEPSLKDHIILAQWILSQVSEDDLKKLYTLAEKLWLTGDVNSVHILIERVSSGNFTLEEMDSQLIRRVFDRNTTIQYINSSPKDTREQLIQNWDDWIINLFRIAMLLTMLGIMYVPILLARNTWITRLSDKIDALQEKETWWWLNDYEKAKLDALKQLLDRVNNVPN